MRRDDYEHRAAAGLIVAIVIFLGGLLIAVTYFIKV